MPRPGLALPTHPGRWAEVADLARAAEAGGWASLWVADPGCAGSAPDGQDGAGSLDPLMVLAALAQLTHRVGLGTLALDAGLRPPGLLATAVATVDRLSGGRVTVGLAPPPGEGPVAGAAVVAEVAEVLRAVFAGDTVTRAGGRWPVAGLRVDPGPVQRPGPPIWVVGEGDALYAVAARHADGWAPGVWRAGPDPAFGAARRALDEACRAAGRDPASLARAACWLPGAGGGGGRDWDGAGVGDLVASPGGVPFGGTSTDDLARARASATE